MEKIDCHPLGGSCGEGKGGVGVGPPSHPISNWGWVGFDGLTMFIGVHFGGSCELPLVIDPGVYVIQDQLRCIFWEHLTLEIGVGVGF